MKWFGQAERRKNIFDFMVRGVKNIIDRDPRNNKPEYLTKGRFR